MRANTSLHLSEELRTEIKKTAKKNKRSMGAQIAYDLERLYLPQEMPSPMYLGSAQIMNCKGEAKE